MNVPERKLGRGKEMLTQGEGAATGKGKSQKCWVNRKVRKTKQEKLTEGKGKEEKGREGRKAGKSEGEGGQVGREGRGKKRWDLTSEGRGKPERRTGDWGRGAGRHHVLTFEPSSN